MIYYGWDPSYIFVLIGAVLSLLASAKVQTTYARYSQVHNHRRMTGAQVAREVLRAQGINDVQVEHVAGKLTDHYDPSSRVLSLSDSTFSSTSVAAAGVAAHECGHAAQHAQGYYPLQLRSSLVPVANFGARFSWILIIIGLFINNNASSLIMNLGILLFCAAVLFQLVTLPVEINASSRALHALESTNLLMPDELGEAKKVLSAAALTYVAAAAASILQLLRLVLLSRRND